jgi:hypothetical protein
VLFTFKLTPNGTGISCDLSVRFELCIFTANDNDVRSGGNVVNKDKRVIFSEHNLEKKRKNARESVKNCLH